MLEKFSEKALKAVMFAQEEARRSNHAMVEPDHLFLGLLRDPDTIAAEVLRAKQLEPARLAAEVQIQSQPGRAPMDISYGEEVHTIFKLADAEAQSQGVSKVDTDHLLLGLVDTRGGQTQRILRKAGLNVNHLRWNTLRHRYIQKNAEIRAAHLDLYSLDLTAKLERGELPHVVEWEPMVERLIQYLGMRHNHNIIMVGEAGVGKTALIHSLNQYILDSRIYPEFAHCRVVFLHVDKMLAEAGTTDDLLYETTKSIISEIRKSGDIILVIENIHHLFLAQKKELEFVITQQLITLLEEPNTYCIATTLPRFYELLEARTAVRHLFQVFHVPEPPRPFCRHILSSWKPRLEKHHQLQIENDLLDEIVSLAGDKASGHLPQSALNLLDLACARRRWLQTQARQGQRLAERQIRHLTQQRALLAEQIAQSPEAKNAFDKVREELLQTETQLHRYQQRLQMDPVILSQEDLKPALEHPGGLS